MNKSILIGINAKYIHSNPAIYSLKAYCDKYYATRPKDCTLSIKEYTINQQPQNIIADIYKERPDFIAFSCYIWNWQMIKDLLPEISKVLPNCHIWLGGPEVSFHCEKILDDFPMVSGIMIGEGEDTLCELLHFYWENDRQLEEIDGIVYKDISIKYTDSRKLTDLDRLPFLYDNLENFNNRIIYYETQRGCPYRCAYCLSSIDKKVRFRNIETVKKELLFFIKNNVPQVKFIDRTFNCNHEHAISIWKFIKENDNNFTNFHFEIAADLIDEEQLNIMKDMRPGLIQLEIGVQSTNEKTLNAINRTMDLNVIKNVVAKIHANNNIHQHLDLIAGLPYEDYQSFANSFNDVYSMEPDQLQLGFLKVLKGSPMEKMAKEHNIQYSSNPPYEVLFTNYLSFDDVIMLKKVEEMVELYYNSGQFTKTLPVLLQNFTSPFEMYEKLALFYDQKGYFVNAPARSYKYQVLYDFANSINPEKSELFSELLIFDMYLRENLKSRPAFSPNNELPKDALHEFFTNEAKSHNLLKDYENCTPAQLARMTHIEAFSYPVTDNNLELNVIANKSPEYLLFDYQHKDVLNNNVCYYKISL